LERNKEWQPTGRALPAGVHSGSVFEESGEVGRPALVFFRGSGTGCLNAGMGEQTGSAVIGEVLEGEVDLRFELGEGGRVASELLSPALLLLGERCLEVL
jgi:hypothetical protein